ncbi:MAG: response regulator [Pirellula sp.]|jgi:HD-like signal output (HDOD) protein|nr:response regulator [Pirellula sp.]
MSKNVLFVDDEANVLSGLRRLLRGQRAIWDMDFACSGAEALKIMEEKSIDVIVSDMRMPRMNGAELLSTVSNRYPKTVRLILSGQSEQEKVLRSIGPAHQFLAKPCDPDVLIGTINRACNLQSRLSDETLQRIVANIAFLPSLPGLFRELMQIVESDNCSIQQLGELIGRDLALSAKVLQLVNSSFFGLAQHVSCTKHAVSLLGLNIIKPLVLLAGTYSQCENPDLDGYSLDREVEHSLAVATLSRSIAASQTNQSHLIDDAYVSGMMHDIGKLILAVNMRETYQDVLYGARDADCPLWKMEQERFGTTHAEMGAYLLALWGFPNSVVEAVAFHHTPTHATNEQFSPLTAVHFANSFLAAPDAMHAEQRRWDQDYEKTLDLSVQIEAWSALANRQSTRLPV